MSGALNEHSQKHEEHKLQLSRIAKDLHDRSQGPNPKDMQAQSMKLVLRVNEINMQLTELRDRPPAAYGLSVVKSNAQTLIHITLERLESVRKAGSNVVILISVASWLQPERNTNVITTFIRAAMKRNLIVVPADFAFWGDHCTGNTGAPANKYRAAAALPALVSAAVDISWTLHRVMSTANAAKTLGLLYKKTMYPPDEDAKAKAEKILQTKVWDDSLTYSAAPPARVVGAESSGPPRDVEMTHASSEVTAPAQVVTPSDTKAPVCQAERKGQQRSRHRRALSHHQSLRPVRPRQGGPLTVETSPRPLSLPCPQRVSAKAPEPVSTAAKGAPPARKPALRSSGGCSPSLQIRQRLRWGGPLPKSALTPWMNAVFRLLRHLTSRKAGEAAKKKAEELKKSKGGMPPRFLPSRKRTTAWMLTRLARRKHRPPPSQAPLLPLAASRLSLNRPISAVWTISWRLDS